MEREPVLKTPGGTARWIGLLPAAALCLASCGGTPPAEDQADARLNGPTAADMTSPAPDKPSAAPAPAAEHAAPKKPGTAADAVWLERLEEVERGLLVQEQQDALMAQRLVERALALKREFKYEQALDTVRQAINLAHDHPEARKLEVEIDSLLDRNPNRMIDKYLVGGGILVSMKQMEAEIDHLVEKGKRYLADGQYVEALSVFHHVVDMLEAIPYEIPLKLRLTEIKTLIHKTEDEQSARLKLGR